jgi:hypothetical protein
MRKICAFTVSLLLLMGCKDVDRPGAPEKRAQTFIGYSLPWTWQDASWEHLGSASYRGGLTFTLIELGGETKEHFEKSIQKLPGFLSVMKDYGIYTEIVIVNSNTCGIEFEDTWYFNYVDQVREMVKGYNVLINPVTEPGNFRKCKSSKKKTQRWLSYAYSKFPKDILVSELDRPWADPFHHLALFREKHWCTDFTSRNIMKGSINSTDCTPLLDPGPVRVAQMTRAAIDTQSHFIMYRGKNDSIVEDSYIDAIGREVQK